MTDRWKYLTLNCCVAIGITLSVVWFHVSETPNPPKRRVFSYQVKPRPAEEIRVREFSTGVDSYKIYSSEECRKFFEGKDSRRKSPLGCVSEEVIQGRRPSDGVFRTPELPPPAVQIY